jgi:hypothetical protein
MQDQHPEAQGHGQANERNGRVQRRSSGQALGEQSDRTEGVERGKGRQGSENTVP